MTGSQIRAALRQDERLKADPAMWEQIKLRAQREMPAQAAPVENPGRLRFVMQRAIRRVPLHYGLLAACVLAVAVSVSALIAVGKQINPFSSASGTLNQRQSTVLSSAGSLPAGAQPGGGGFVSGTSSRYGSRSSTGSAALPSSSRTSSKTSSVSPAHPGTGNAGASGGSGSSGTAVSSGTSSGSSSTGSASSGSSGTMQTQSSEGNLGGAAIPANPFFLSYRNKIYSTSGVFGFRDAALATPGVVLGHFTTTGGDVLSGRAVYGVNGVDRSKQLCVPDVNDSTKFGRYYYLCNQTFSLGGTTYSLSGGQITDVTATTAMQNDVVGNFSAPVSNSGAIAGSDDSTGSGDSLPANTPPSSVSGASNCVLTLLIYPSSDITSRLQKIGSLSTSKVYAINGIDPSAAIVMNGNSRWFLAVSTNYKKISYDDLQNLIAQKGLTLFVH